MVKIETWKILLSLIVVLMGGFYALPNTLNENVRANLPSFLPVKTVNLGLDLRGGAHLLYQLDMPGVFKDRSEAMIQALRKELRSEKIGYRRIGGLDGGVRVTLRKEEDAPKARKIMRGLEQGLIVNTSGEGGLILEAVYTDEGRRDVYKSVISQAIEVVRRRVDELGTTEPVIQRQGEDRLLVQAPGADAEELKNIIGKTAKMTFHLVADPSASANVRTVSYPLDEDEMQQMRLNRTALITGDMLSGAAYSQNQNGEHAVSFRMNNTGARIFCDVTRENTGKPFAIVLDKRIISSPVIREPICGGQGQISGSFTVKTANDLALLLRAGALPAEMKVVEERTVGPSLGADSVAAGKVAAIIGLAGVLVFMAISYGFFGLMANVALAINVVLIFALLSMMQATLTLPGIAGIVLTIGMAVDANVLIFERIREEFRLGRSVISAIDAGYSRAMATIVDSNLTTLIAAVILFSFGTGPIKGFAVTLGIGIITSFFTAIMITRILVVLWLNKNRSSKTIPV